MVTPDQQMLLNRYVTCAVGIPDHIQAYIHEIEENYMETISFLEEDIDTSEKEHAIDIDNKDLEIEDLKERIKDLEGQIERLKQVESV